MTASPELQPTHPALPRGWVVRRASNDEILILSAEGNLIHAADKGSFHGRMLFALADALLRHSDADPSRAAIEELLARVESAMNYTQATLSPGNQGRREGEWVQVHGGRATSAYRQLQIALDELEQLRKHLASNAPRRT